MLALLAAVLIVLVSSALWSMIEAAIFSMPLTKARHLAEKSQNGKVVLDVKTHPARPISTIVIFNNISNIVGTYVVAHIATGVLSPSAQTWFPIFLTACIILFSEIVPKTIGERFCVPITKFVSRPLCWITRLLMPLVWAIEMFTCLFTKGRPIQTTSEQEIRALSKIAHQEGMIDDDENQMIGKVFELDDVVASDIMTPRTAMTWIRGIEPLTMAKEDIAKSEHSRIVVVGETMDEVRGIMLKSTLLNLLVSGYSESDLVQDHIEKVKLVKEETPADELLAYFKQSCIHLAIVIDQYGGVTGLVTLEDALEVLTGEIVDETDKCTDMRQVALQNGILRLKEQGAKHESYQFDSSTSGPRINQTPPQPAEHLAIARTGTQD